MRCIVRTKLPLDALRRSGTTLSLRTQLVPNPLSLMCFRKDQLIRIKKHHHARDVCFLWPHRSLVLRQAVVIFGQVGTDATLQACACSGQIGASCRAKRSLSSVKSGQTQRSRRALAQAKSGPRAASSGLPLRSNQDRHSAPGMRLLGPNRGLCVASSGLPLRSNQDRRSAPGVRLLGPNRGLCVASSGLPLRSRR
jgi:hypothetical protein